MGCNTIAAARTLHHAIFHRRDAQRTSLGLGLIFPYINAPDRTWSVGFRSQFLRQRQKPNFSQRRIFRQRFHLKLIHSSSALVGDHLIKRIGQYVPPIQLYLQTIEPPARLRFCFTILHPLQLPNLGRRFYPEFITPAIVKSFATL